jgi:hypothetical protein
MVVAASIDFTRPSGPEAFYWLYGLGAASALLALLLALGTTTLTSPPSIREPAR